MKTLTFFLLVLVFGSCASIHKAYKSEFSKHDMIHIKNAIRIAEEKPTSVVRRSSDNQIVIEFPTQIWVLAPSGYVLSVCELIDGIWDCSGPKDDAF